MDSLFWISALMGTAFFGLKVVASFFGGVSEDVDLVEGDGSGLEHESDKAFKVISLHSLTGFFMMFGWVGLACTQQYELTSSLSILIAFVAGILMMIVTAYLFKLAGLLVSSGTQFHIEELLGRRASVYQKIQSSGVGKIQITVNGYQREVRAVSENHQEIGSFTEVTIEKVVDHRTVSVKPVENV